MTPYLLAFFIAASVAGWTKFFRSAQLWRAAVSAWRTRSDEWEKLAMARLQQVGSLSSKLVILQRENEEQAEKLSRVASFREYPAQTAQTEGGR